jgi:hypothetical protein
MERPECLFVILLFMILGLLIYGFWGARECRRSPRAVDFYKEQQQRVVGAPGRRGARLDELIEPSDLRVIQGNTIPNDMGDVVAPIADEFANHPSVDGSRDGPRSMFMMAYNKCSPSCCAGQSSQYSCNGGCVCLTPEQKGMFR